MSIGYKVLWFMFYFVYQKKYQIIYNLILVMFLRALQRLVIFISSLNHIFLTAISFIFSMAFLLLTVGSFLTF